MSYPVGNLCFFYLLYDKEDPVYFYVGSTWNMNRRMMEHRTNSTCLYIRDMGLQKLGFELLEPAREVHSDEERFFIEQWYIEILMPTLNVNRAYYDVSLVKERNWKFNHSEEGKAYRYEYNRSEVRRECLRVYAQSEPFKNTQLKYQHTDKGKQTSKKYDQSIKGKENHRNYRIRKIVRKVMDDMLAVLN